MQDLTPTSVNNSSVPDYTGDGVAARQLAKQVQEYYHKQGSTDVRCWVEPIVSQTSRKLWTIQSNITFSISELQKSFK